MLYSKYFVTLQAENHFIMKKIILSKRFLHGVLLTLAFCLLPVLPALAQGDIVDRLDKALGVTLPNEYKSKVKEFVKTNKVISVQ